MEPTNCAKPQYLPLKQLITDAIREIERLGYSRRSRNRYRAIWEHFIEFSERNEPGGGFSGDLAVRFLEEYRGADEEPGRPVRGWCKHIAWGVQVLAGFAKNGRIERAFADVDGIQLVPAMQDTLRDYLQYCKDRLYLRAGTLGVRSKELTIFLDFLSSKKSRTLDLLHLQSATDTSRLGGI